MQNILLKEIEIQTEIEIFSCQYFVLEIEQRKIVVFNFCRQNIKMQIEKENTQELTWVAACKPKILS